MTPEGLCAACSATQKCAEHDDALYSSAVDLVIRTQSASVSMLQRRLRIGFSTAAGYLDEMETLGIVSAFKPGGGREVLVKDKAHS